MKNKPTIKHLSRLIIAGMLIFSGCLSTVSRPDVLLVGSIQEIPSIQEAYANRLSKVAIGMDLQSFRSIFPEAYTSGQSSEITAYELVKKTQYALKGDWNPYYRNVQDLATKTDLQVLWFYFYEDILVKWGKPRDWPEHPNRLIENQKPAPKRQEKAQSL